MGVLFRGILKWLGSKLAALIAIIIVLLLAFWFRNEWAEISKLLQQTSSINGEIEKKEGSIAKLRRETQQLGDDARKAITELESLDRVASLARSEAQKAKEDAEAWSKRVGFWQYWFEKWKVVEKGKAWTKHQVKEAEAKIAEVAVEKARKAQQDSPWALNQARLDAEQKDLNSLRQQKEEMTAAVARTPAQKLILAVREVLPTALWILAGVIFLPIGIKGVLFFWIAPLADKVAPINIVPSVGAPPEPQLLTSGVSVNVEVRGEDELLAHPDYLQSTPKSATKKTKWFLNHRLPFSSMASGMCLLTRVRASDNGGETVKISPMKDPLGEVALIELPDGAAMVLYPRSLVAVVKPQDQEILITRRWRLRSLHSWLTLQFRYLVFHGPCKVVVKGCRGVCLEKPVPEKPRQISQAATIGFSASLGYSNTRSEVFLSYLLGKDELFNDLFGGENGVFLYEEMPDFQRKAGLTGRGIEGMTDAVLKAFGV